ncbi:MAG TPA: DUF2071 domain-containing protein [Tepidisphaeraceae bacterium]|nr:DUF2071 domain-containing protein [Tepidisphaeraceae bacterium]
MGSAEIAANAPRPWPAPDRAWRMFMRWHELLFMHWPVAAGQVRSLLPKELELDLFDGSAWIGVVPFRMSGIRARGLPPIPGTSAFPELNVRTYVTVGGKPGVWFFSLDATNRLAVRAARWGFFLPYFDAHMHVGRTGSRIEYSCTRTHRKASPAKFDAEYGPAGEVFEPRSGTLDHFLTARYCLYAMRPDRGVHRCDISHMPWPLQRATAHIHGNTMAAAAGIELPRTEPLLHYAHQLDVVAWTADAVG